MEKIIYDQDITEGLMDIIGYPNTKIKAPEHFKKNYQENGDNCVGTIFINGLVGDSKNSLMGYVNEIKNENVMFINMIHTVICDIKHQMSQVFGDSRYNYSSHNNIAKDIEIFTEKLTINRQSNETKYISLYQTLIEAKQSFRDKLCCVGRNRTRNPRDNKSAKIEIDKILNNEKIEISKEDYNEYSKIYNNEYNFVKEKGFFSDSHYISKKSSNTEMKL